MRGGSITTSKLLALAIVLFTVTGVVADDDDLAYEFCQGDGSICSAWLDLTEECDDKESSKYIECTCTSGMLSVQQACEFCKESTGQKDISFLDESIDSCKSQDISIAPIPTSIISQQKERNKTLSVGPSATEFSFTIETPGITGETAILTTTLSGMADMTLPSLEGPSPTDAAPGLKEYGLSSWWCWTIVVAVSSVMLLE